MGDCSDPLCLHICIKSLSPKGPTKKSRFESWRHDSPLDPLPLFRLDIHTSVPYTGSFQNFRSPTRMAFYSYGDPTAMLAKPSCSQPLAYCTGVPSLATRGCVCAPPGRLIYFQYFRSIAQSIHLQLIPKNWVHLLKIPGDGQPVSWASSWYAPSCKVIMGYLFHKPSIPTTSTPPRPSKHL